MHLFFYASAPSAPKRPGNRYLPIRHHMVPNRSLAAKPGTPLTFLIFCLSLRVTDSTAKVIPGNDAGRERERVGWEDCPATRYSVSQSIVPHRPAPCGRVDVPYS